MATLDVRPLIANGVEPFEQIMTAVGQLEMDEDFVIIAPFEPVPLEGVLGSQGFVFDAVEIGAGDWRVTFSRSAS